jgi:hypothetical protein
MPSTKGFAPKVSFHCTLCLGVHVDTGLNARNVDDDGETIGADDIGADDIGASPFLLFYFFFFFFFWLCKDKRANSEMNQTANCRCC